MAVSPGFLEYVVEQLDGCGPIVTKRMFGAVGVYRDEVFFAIIDNDILYLKVDESNRADFERAGSAPFRPYGDERESMSYFSVPVSILEDADELGAWGRRAIAAAVAAKRRPRTNKRRR